MLKNLAIEVLSKEGNAILREILSGVPNAYEGTKRLLDPNEAYSGEWDIGTPLAAGATFGGLASVPLAITHSMRSGWKVPLWKTLGGYGLGLGALGAGVSALSSAPHNDMRLMSLPQEN